MILASLGLGSLYVGRVALHYVQYPDVGLRIDFDRRVLGPATGVRPGDLVAGAEATGGYHRFRSSFEMLAFLRKHLSPGQRAIFRFERGGREFRREIVAARPPLLPRLAYLVGSYLALVTLCAALWWTRRREPGTATMVLCIWIVFLVLVALTDLSHVISAADLTVTFLVLDLAAAPLVLHLFLHYPERKGALAARPLRLALAYAPQVAVGAAAVWFYVALVQNPGAAQQQRMVFVGRYLVPAGNAVYAAAAVAALVHTFVRAEPLVRKQVLWIVYGLVTALALVGVVWAVRRDESYYRYLFGQSDYLLAVYALLGTTMALSFARFRLIDLDRIVNRTFVYAVLSVAVASVYLVASAGLGLLFSRHGAVTTVVATVLATALFIRLREVVQENVDRLFFGARYRAARVLHDVSHEIVTILEIDRLLDRLLDVLVRTLGTQGGAALLRGGAAGWQLVRGALPGPLPAPGAIERLRLRADDEPVAAPASRSLVRVRAQGAEEAVVVRTAGQAATFDALGAEVVVWLGDDALLALGRKAGGALWTRDDLELLHTIAHQAAVAVRNARAYSTIEVQRGEILALQARLRDENVYLRQELRNATHFGAIVGTSEELRSVLATVERVAPSDATVLLAGESGTGKELIARAIHDLSPRAHGPFVAVNCAAIPETLIESELFGHEKGAFTGAVAARRGRFELAEGGTLFLDEIGEMPVALQPKLLRALQEREIVRVGGEAPVRVDVRVVAASNRDLEQMVARATFRDDLYYRLAVVPVRIPPLRDRRADIPALAQFFLERFARKHGKALTGISQSAMTRMLAYRWPGNVREIANVIERACVLADRSVLDQEITFAGTEAPTEPAAAAAVAPTRPFHDSVEEFKRQAIAQAIAQAGGNQAEAARRLGLQRTYLYRLVRELGLRPPAS